MVKPKFVNVILVDKTSRCTSEGLTFTIGVQVQDSYGLTAPSSKYFRCQVYASNHAPSFTSTSSVPVLENIASGSSSGAGWNRFETRA